ncbi:RHS repeat-associated core domain-containing protein, partial [Flavobacterium lindanitolerans]|uniref:RHS repeat-associated core domain-containing protein n=1 Tax=Flavobacterium lindanitolerans TaxID=428988 RepID=UPI002809A87D
EGYVRATVVNGTTAYSYVYNYTDHLGNIRLSYAQDPASPTELKILEENHYYPYGLKHTNYNSDLLVHREYRGTLGIKDPGPIEPLVPVLPYNYKYNGKEFQDEMGLNMYDYGARNYDPAIGRWMNMDPLAEMSKRFSPYTYAYDNPVFFVDPDGMLAVYDWDAHNSGNKGVYKDGDKEVSFSDAMAGYGLNQDGSEKDKAYEAKGNYESMIKQARIDGHDLAADNLQRWLNGTGGTKVIGFKKLRSYREIVSGENENIDRFETQLEKLANGLADGESGTLNDYWDNQITGGITGELYYASGRSILTSTGSFKITRKGDKFIVSGSISHTWRDTYDWHEGATAYIPGFGNVKDSDAKLVEKYCGAKPFEMTSSWKQNFTGTYSLGFFGGISINLNK